MKRLIPAAALLGLLLVLAGPARAVDLSKGLLLDIPEEIAARQFRQPIISTLSAGDSLAVTSFRFS
ncbi:MAG: hypothetical protein HY851_07770, partial [candidate division Zixibacteria bacterium]|nr:hypothetical protein [candidate division Zixibacteria bacterium]